MKTKYLLTLLLMSVSLSFIHAVPVPIVLSLDCESGDRDIDAANCWGLGGFVYTNTSTLLISGSWTARSGQLTNPDLSAFWVKSPWMLLNSGNITFKTRLDGNPGTTRSFVVSYVPYDATSAGASKEGALFPFYTYTFSSPTTTDLQNVSIPVPSAVANSGIPYKIQISYPGTGGTGRALIDDIAIPGAYYSNPSNGCLPLVVIADADGDGVADDDDDYPADPYKAYNNYFPSALTYGSLFFEDLWPSKGDYDFNDLVLSYRINSITNSAGNVVEQNYTYIIRAAGAVFHNGFGFQLTGINPNSVIRVTGTDVASGYSINSQGLEVGQISPTVIVFEDALRFFPGRTGVVNTDTSLPFLAPHQLNVRVVFMENGVPGSGGVVTLSQVVIAEFNPFIVVDGDRGREVHLAYFAPTSLASSAFFHTLDDTYNAGAHRYYVTSTNLPWALNIPSEIKYATEESEFNWGYLHFLSWAQSGGSLYSNWHIDLPGYRNETFLY